MEKNYSRKGSYTTKRSDDGNRPARRSYGRRSNDENRPSSPRNKEGYKPKSYRPKDAESDGYKPRTVGSRKPYEHKSEDHKTGSYKSREYKPREYKPREYKPKDYTPKSKPAVRKKAADDGLVRLNKFIANSGICSRREADTYIQTGLVSVNGVKVTELGAKVNPEKDEIRFNGERIKGEKKVYIVMNKPKDFVTTLSDPHAENTVMDLISKTKCPERVFPVGRLDKATTGVLLFTNDGELTEMLTHPSHKVKKIYHAHLDRNLAREDFEAILNGIVLEDGPIAADALSYVDEDKSQVGLEIHSGRNRIVRRIFEHFGYKVKKLDRVYFAGLTKKNIRRGEWRFLTEKEVSLLKMGAFE